VLGASAAIFSLTFGASAPARAVPVAGTPAPSSRTTDTPSPLPASADVLPFDSSLIFVLDDTISSQGSHKDQPIRAHLKDALVIGGRTVAAAGTTATIRVLTAEPAQMGDVYGYVDIYFEPLQLPGIGNVPLHAPTSHLTVNVSTGHTDTVAVEDTIEDITIPYHYLYHVFRKGRNFVLGPGAQIRARTLATIIVDPRGPVAIATPEPFSVQFQTPHATFPTRNLASPPAVPVRQPPTAPPLTPERPGTTPPPR